MPRIQGVDLPPNKPTHISLRYLKGIGPTTSLELCAKVGIDPQRAARASHEEPFGPIAVLLPFDTEEEAIAEANRLPVGLAAYAFTRDLPRAHRLAAQLQCGSLALNDWAVSMPETPFGGMLDSGYGLEGGWQGLREFTQVVTVRTGLVGL